jgi:hypothetical protein
MGQELESQGANLNAKQIEEILKFLFTSNLANEEKNGARPTPVCIWGTHGLGKTWMAKAFAKENGWKFAYCAPAQFEEMGDLHGLPMKMDPNPDVHGDEYTVYLPPDWVPTEEGPGILLLDDLNRADDRILRGTMQLIQDFEMFSWTLPPKWQIVCTANPEGGDYSVTPMDDAMLTRMMHVTMVFDAKVWAVWADRAGVDKRGISFVLTYPESVTGKRTTPRSLTQFFGMITHIPDLKAELDKVAILAASALDEITVANFLSFVTENLTMLIDPEDILEAKDFKAVSKEIDRVAKGDKGAVRVDLLSTICTRLSIYMARPDFKASDVTGGNLVSFMLHKALPNDLRFSLHKELTALGGEPMELLRDPKLAKLILGGM